MPDGKDVFDLLGSDLFEIASNAKLFTTAAALAVLGEDYRFRTAVIANGVLRGDALDGDLVLVGGGDPSLSGRFHNGDAMAVPKAIAAAVREKGIRLVIGDLVMDDRLFDRIGTAAGWPDEDLLWWYGAPVSALSFNDNCIDVIVRGGKRVGAAARVEALPRIPYVRVRNRCITVAAGAREGVTFERGEDGLLALAGRIRIGSVRSEDVAVTDPPMFLASAVRTALGDAGVIVRGRDRLVREGERAIPEAREIFVWQSSLVDAVSVANRRSQNFYAEQILKTLGAERSGTGTFESGVAAVEAFLKENQFPEGVVKLKDGSGLSAGNRATPQAIAALLELMYRSEHRKTFFASLAVSGEKTTTLRHRLGEAGTAGRIHAKTGTIASRGIIALSGYAVAGNGEVYAFCILTNGFKRAHLTRARQMEDALCRVLVTWRE